MIVLEQPPRPDKLCYRCQQDAWRPGCGCWVCDVCHPANPVMQRHTPRPERVDAWQGEIPKRMREALAAPSPFFGNLVEKYSTQRTEN